MQNRSLKKALSNTLYLGLIITTALLPLAPISSIAAEVKNNTATIILDDQSKTQVPETAVEASATTVPAKITDTSETTATTVPTETSKASATPKLTSKYESEGMSTGMKYTLGIGGAVVALVGIAALAGGGSSDSSPTPPTEAQMVGPWSAAANSVDGRTYTGTYTLYSGGTHTYEIFVSDGQYKVGSGAWKLVEYDLELRNFGGSTYRGTFSQGVKNTVTTVTTDHRWRNILTK